MKSRCIFVMPANLFRTLNHAERAGLRVILNHTEGGAVYMAQGYARASGKPAVVVAQAGPGATNTAAALADAFQMSVPIVALTGGNAPLYAVHRNAYQGVQPHFESVTKFSVDIPLPERTPDLLRQAFREATTGVPGPVHLALDNRHEDAELPTHVPRPSQFSRVPAYRFAPSPDDLSRAVAQIENSERPVIMAGGGVVTSGAAAELVAFAEHYQVPVATSLSGKGSIPETHPLAIGVAGAYGRRAANELLKDSDLVIFVGTRTGSQSTASWTVPPTTTPAIHINVNGAEIGQNYPDTTGLVGDAKLALQALVDLRAETPPRLPEARHRWLDDSRQLIRDWWTAVDSRASSSQQPITPERLCREVTEVLPEDAIVVTDTGYLAAWAGTLLEMRYPTQAYFRCEGSLGWGIPGAIGVKCAQPDRAVIALSGDGGAYYHFSEIETAVRLGLNMVFVIMNNSALAFETHVMKYHYGEDDSQPMTLSAFSDVDFATVARGLGAQGVRVERAEDLGHILADALATDGPVVIDVVTDPVEPAPVTFHDPHRERRF